MDTPLHKEELWKLDRNKAADQSDARGHDDIGISGEYIKTNCISIGFVLTGPGQSIFETMVTQEIGVDPLCGGLVCVIAEFYNLPSPRLESARLYCERWIVVKR